MRRSIDVDIVFFFFKDILPRLRCGRRSSRRSVLSWHFDKTSPLQGKTMGPAKRIMRTADNVYDGDDDDDDDTDVDDD